MNARYMAIHPRLRSDFNNAMSSCPSPVLSTASRSSPLASYFTSPAQTPPMTPPPAGIRMRTLSIASVSSTTSEAIASRMRHLSVRSDDSNQDTETMSTPTASPQRVALFERSAPFVDHTGEPGVEEVDGEVDVYLAAEPSVNGKRPEDLLWIICWHVGSMATGVRVVRRAGGVMCTSDRDYSGEALVNIMKTNEALAGTSDLKLMHMYQHPLGKLDLKQRRALRHIALQTSHRELPAVDRRSFRPRVLSHREWMETLMQEAIEQNLLRHEKVTEAFSTILRSNEW